MPEITSHPPGSFCWIELATTDARGAVDFYTKVFDWSVNEMPMGEGMGSYYMFQMRGKDVGAMYEQQKEQREQGIPPNWASYVSVESADQTAAKAKELGGTVVMEPFDVFDFGRMAVILDPQGAAFCLWQPMKHHGLSIVNEPGALCWNELASPNAESARSFYTQLFGWTTKISPEYTEWMAGDQVRGGMLETNEEKFPGVPPHWGIYFAVEDADASVAKATANGAAVVVPATDIPHVGRFALLRDPQGAHFSVIKLMLEAH